MHLCLPVSLTANRPPGSLFHTWAIVEWGNLWKYPASRVTFVVFLIVDSYLHAWIMMWTDKKKIIVCQYSDWRYMKQKETNLKLKISNKVTSSNCLLKCLNDIYTPDHCNWFAVHSIMLTQITNYRIRDIFHILSSYSFSSSVQNVLFSI